MDGWSIYQQFDNYLTIRRWGKLEVVFETDRQFNYTEKARMLEEYKNTGNIKGLRKLNLNLKT